MKKILLFLLLIPIELFGQVISLDYDGWVNYNLSISGDYYVDSLLVVTCSNCEDYQWFYADDNLGTNEQLIKGEIDDSIIIPDFIDGKYIYVKSMGDESSKGLVSFSTDSKVSLKEGCMTVDGAGYINIPDADNLSFGNGTTDTPFSVMAWVYMTDATEFRFLSKTQTVNLEYLVFFNGDDRLTALLYNNAGTSIYIGRQFTTASTGLQNAWHHVTMTYDGSETSGGIKLYIDTVQVDNANVASGTYVAMNNSTAPLTIGRDRTTYAKGRISDVRIFGKAVSQSEIGTIYKGRATAVQDGDEIAWWPITEGHGNTIFDVVGVNDGLISNTTIDAFWANKQTVFKYNYNHGSTMVENNQDTLIFPYNANGIKTLKNGNLYIIYGQSNALGRANIDSLSVSDRTKYGSVFDSVFIVDTSTFVWTKLDQGINNMGDEGNVKYFGPELSLAYNLQREENEYAYIIKYGKAATSIYPSDGDDWNVESTGELYSRFVVILDSAVKTLICKGINPQLVGYCLMQGETDAATELAGLTYKGNLLDLFAHIDARVRTPYSNKIIGRIPDYNYDYRDYVRTAHVQCADYWIDTDAFSTKVGDAAHFDHDGQILLGDGYYNKVKDLHGRSMLKTYFGYSYQIHEWP